MAEKQKSGINVINVIKNKLELSRKNVNEPAINSILVNEEARNLTLKKIMFPKMKENI